MQHVRYHVPGSSKLNVRFCRVGVLDENLIDETVGGSLIVNGYTPKTAYVGLVAAPANGWEKVAVVLDSPLP